MKKINKVKIIAIVLLLCIICVNTAFAKTNSITLESFSVLDSSQDVIVDNISTEDGVGIANVTFCGVGDSITYKLVVKNNDTKDYVIKSIEDSNTNEYISYTYDVENVEFKQGQEVEIIVTAKYEKEVEDVNNREQVVNVEFTLSLEDTEGNVSEEKILVIPNTGDNVILYIILFTICISVIILVKNKKLSKHIKGLYIITGVVCISVLSFVNASTSINAKISINAIYKLQDKIVINIQIDGVSQEQTINYGDTIERPQDPTKDGYTFIGWYDEEDNEYDFSKPVTEDLVLIPKYEANTYVVVYDANRGQGEMENDTFTYDQEKALTVNAYEKEGYTFTGWNTDPQGNGTSYEDSEVVKNLKTSGSITLYAMWCYSGTIQVGDTINYNANLDENKNIFANEYEYVTNRNITGSNTVSEFKSSDSMVWKVFEIDDDGAIKIIPIDGTQNTVTLNSQKGFINGIDVLNDISAVYGHGYGAASSRSMTIEDVEKYASYDKYTFKTNNVYYGQTRNYTSGKYFKEIKDSEGNVIDFEDELTEASTTNPITLTMNYYQTRSARNYFDEHMYNLLFIDSSNNKKSYFLASRCSNPWNVAYAFQDFYMIKEDRVEAQAIYYSTNNPNQTWKAMPMVTLKADLIYTYNEDTDSWNIE